MKPLTNEIPKKDVKQEMPTIWDTMQEDAIQMAGYWRPEVGKINAIRILTDPRRGSTNFKSGENRPQYEFIINTLEDPKKSVVYSVSAKGAMQQIVAILKANGLTTLVGAVLQISVTGEGMKRQYVIIPRELPTAINQAQVLLDFPLETLKKNHPKFYEAAIPQAPAPSPVPAAAPVVPQ